MTDISELINGHLDHTLTPEQSQELGAWISADPRNARLFAREVFVHSRLRDILAGEQYLQSHGQPEFLASASAVTDPKKHLANARISRRRIQPVRRWLIAASVLLMLSLATLAWWHQRTKGQRPAATALTDAAEAQWENASPQEGASMPLGSSLTLKSGCVEISLASGGQLIIEGPATFTMRSPTTILLEHGKLSAKIPGGGFVVNTPTSRITDLGTEFGVAVDADATRVEVFRGKVQTALAAATGSTQMETLTEGQAARVFAGRVDVDPEGAMPQHFVRSFAEKISALDVVDLVAGGDGTTHRRGVGIDMSNGQWGALPQAGEVAPDGQYHRVPLLPVVDGVFIPDSRRGPSTVDSAGHQFILPTSYSGSFMHLWAGGPIPFPPPGNAPVSSVLAGVNYAQEGHGLLEMHANKGLTLDLAAIRHLHPRQTITHFHALLGNSKVTSDNPPELSSAYVLVDGKLRFSREKFTGRDGAEQVDIPLQPEDRFLTLAVTDGEDSTVTFDHVLWADPILELGPNPR